MILYLEMKQSDLPPLTDVGINIRVEIPNVEAAPALRDSLAAQFFVGHTHTDQIHYHYADQPCTVEPLP